MPHAPRTPLRQLGESDAAFIYSDSEHANSNVTLLHIYDQTTAPGGVVRFKQILTHLENRLSQLPIFRQKILRVPLDLDYPYWVEDENFDIEYHVRHIALPKPGDWRQFCIQASRIHARPLDLQRPLWEMYVIEGLDSFLDLPVGSFAVLLKVHHAAVDVAHDHEITRLLHDLTPDPPPDPPPRPWFAQSPPGTLALMWRAGFHAASFPMRLAGSVSQGLGMMALTVKTLAGEFWRRPHDFPVTRFNTVVSAHRVFDTRRFALAECKRIQTLVDGATINDVVLAVCAGGLRRYLELQCELPAASLLAAAPIAVHTDKGSAQDAFSWVRVRLQTDEPDALKRLRAIAATTSSNEVLDQAAHARGLTDLASQAPALAIAATSKMMRAASARLGDWTPLANCSITNVQGPQAALYLKGARLTYLSAIMPIADGMGLVFSVTSYNEMLVISFTACYEQLPDPEVLAQCLRDSFQEYLGLLGPALLPVPKVSPARGRKPRPARKRPLSRPAQSRQSA
ncbi:MAG: wax ester/triacylglycerol synthase family O-acyltransferase [Rhodoferax sp.]|uniref:wax ester/triacylglycerol synthase family O-acyltransferase n=1 Tax=Rhodoferax sp. TaxID=50421 RepID=UPI001B4B07DA|nr:wax ester/triacylglycerol synthase family O-acyltransferase [Rhodoferax sp.]MBP9905028.1 wax ester/triacylglycerol synthase family O-acyltransferase [Rhodoferax sp.]